MNLFVRRHCFLYRLSKHSPFNHRTNLKQNLHASSLYCVSFPLVNRVRFFDLEVKLVEAGGADIQSLSRGFCTWPWARPSPRPRMAFDLMKQDVPLLRRGHTDTSYVQKSRALYLSKSLEEKEREARWRRQDVVDLNEVLTWPEYAEDLGMDTSALKKPADSSTPDLNSKVSVWQGDITKLDVDAIVNAANSSLMGGGGVDGAIHRAAGSHLGQECRNLAGCDTGDAKMSGGYLLPSRYVIHTVGPIVHGPAANAGHRDSLQSCYATCLRRVLDHNKRNRAKLDAKKRRQDSGKGDSNVSDGGEDVSKDDKEEASANGKQIAEDEGGSDILKSLRYDFEAPEPLIRSVAFPCISTGVYGYPQEDASRVALGTIRDWLQENPDEVDRIVFCVFLDKDLKIYSRLLPDFFPLDGTSSGSRNEDDDET